MRTIWTPLSLTTSSCQLTARPASLAGAVGLLALLAVGCWRDLVPGTCNDGTEDRSVEECDRGEDNQDPETARPGECTWLCEIATGCGDKKVDDKTEECDGEEWCNSECMARKECGDGHLDDDEECDPGNDETTAGGAPPECTEKCKFAPRCGDGEIDAGEECDLGDETNVAAADAVEFDCTKECKSAPAVCGNGTPETAEDCDWGASNKDTQEARLDDCTTECKHARCGDGKKNADEQCDDGNAILSDECPSGPSGSCRMARCGDGWVSASYEECDDGNNEDSDACNNQCSAPRIVFLSEKTWVGGTLGGLVGADEKCQAEASEAGLPGEYRAWLSDSQTSPKSRFRSEDFTGRYILPANRGQVAVGWTGLTSGSIESAIVVHANGSINDDNNGVKTWTNTDTSGGVADAKDNCGNWNNPDITLESAVVGWAKIGVVDTNWTVFYERRSCTSTRHLYCVGLGQIW